MVLKCLKSALLADQHDVSTVTAADMALRLVGYIPFDLIIPDYSMPRMDGLKFLEIAQERCPGIPVIMITGYGTAETAIEAMAKGAFDYLTKPFSLDALRSTVMAAQEYVRARKSIGSLTRPGPADLPYCNIVAASAVMKDVCKRISEFARQDCPVLLGGEPGTGKEIVARTIHANSPRKAESFAVIDCTAVSGTRHRAVQGHRPPPASPAGRAAGNHAEQAVSASRR
jgi:DNA-binding NtrC family response regulator